MSIQHIIRRVLMEETQEQKVLHIPSLKVFGLDRLEAWNNLQNFLERKGNPPYSIGGDLDFSKKPSILQSKPLGNLQSVGGELGLRYTPLSDMYTKKQIRQMVNVGGDIYL